MDYFKISEAAVGVNLVETNELLSDLSAECEALGVCGLERGMKGVALLSITMSRLSCWTMGNERWDLQSPSVTISHTHRAAVWSSDGPN